MLQQHDDYGTCSELRVITGSVQTCGNYDCAVIWLPRTAEIPSIDA
jgi:hypothetical protein